jgi:hypothetical protein
MNVPDFLHPHVAQLLSIETDGADKRRLWAIIYNLIPYQDGNQWCVLLGNDIQSGIVGFGDSPYDAIMDFENQMYKKL